ncbi:MAG: AAA family ATPase [Candidatus Hadarchaeaceae archaeon]
MAPRIIGIVGLPGSGKSEVARIFAKFGVPCVRMGEVVWEELRHRGGRITENNVARVSTLLRKREGMGAIAKRCLPIIKKVGKGQRAVIVDGIRGIAEVEVFRKLFGKNFHLIGCWSNQMTRYRRTSSRKRSDDADDLRSFHTKDKRELSWGLGEALALADFIIVNEDSLQELEERTMELFKKIVCEDR